jgi:hypothetical protein
LIVFSGENAASFAADANDEVNSLALVFSLSDYDHTCHKLDAPSRARLDAFGQETIRRSHLPEDKRAALLKDLEKVNPNSSIDCNKKYEMFDKALEIFRTPSNESGDNGQTTKDADWGWKQARQMLQAFPKGQLTLLVGCYANDHDPRMQLCLRESGDIAALRLESGKSHAVCDLAQGEARRRGESAYFYAAQPKHQCSDGSRITHAEGLCKPSKDAHNLDCVISVYEKENEFYKFKGSEDYLNLHEVLVKAP